MHTHSPLQTHQAHWKPWLKFPPCFCFTWWHAEWCTSTHRWSCLTETHKKHKHTLTHTRQKSLGESNSSFAWENTFNKNAFCCPLSCTETMEISFFFTDQLEGEKKDDFCPFHVMSLKKHHDRLEKHGHEMGKKSKCANGPPKLPWEARKRMIVS